MLWVSNRQFVAPVSAESAPAVFEGGETSAAGVLVATWLSDGAAVLAVARCGRGSRGGRTSFGMRHTVTETDGFSRTRDSGTCERAGLCLPSRSRGFGAAIDTLTVAGKFTERREPARLARSDSCDICLS